VRARCNTGVEKTERDAILRQGVVLPETPRERRQREGLDHDLLESPYRGKPVSLRLTNFRPRAESYLAAARGPLAYMLRLREIEKRTAEHEERLQDAWGALTLECDGDLERFAREWGETAAQWSFDEVNDLVDRHNRWYPVEAELAMDPRTGDYVPVNGRDYRRPFLDADWILARFPASLERAPSAAA
jgi:hypothetical protein